MKTFLTILICIFSQTIFGQFAVISDKDGFVNVRSSAGVTNNNIIDTLLNGEVVFCLEAENDWFPIDYDLNQQNKSGYIHKSRLKFIEDFEKISYSSLTDSVISFKSNFLKLTITTGLFNPKNNKLQFYKGNSSKNEASYLEKINGKEIWGTDGNIPKNQYVQILLQLGKDKISLPIDNLFEPNLDFTKVNIDSDKIYISSINSDGAGGYAVLWIIENGKFKQRITTIPF